MSRVCYNVVIKRQMPILMMINDIITAWKEESVIDDSKLSDELIRTPSLHATYLRHFSAFKQEVSSIKYQQSKMQSIKRRYYRGECTKQELDQYEWQQWQGLKPSQAELNQLFEMDKELSLIKRKLSDAEDAVKVLEYILKEINARSYTLRSLIDYQKFLAGN